MPVKEAEVRFTTDSSSCPRCGHPTLNGAAKPRGNERLWFMYCPACRTVQEHAAIPEWFCRGLPAPAAPRILH